ncbi:E3 ubiquitin-protein ligase Praja-2 [Bienertia sinuspersici]
MKIQLYGTCAVTRDVGLKNVVKCAPEMSATISHAKLTNVKGVTVTLYFFGIQYGEVMTVTQVVVEPAAFPLRKTLQFKSAEGLDSPKFPIFFFPDQPPKCDAHLHLSLVDDSAAANNDYQDDSTAANNDYQDVPSWVYEYGRLLPLVAA